MRDLPTANTPVEAFDVVTQTWLSLPPLTTPRSAPAAVVLDGAIYVIGGLDSAGQPLASVEVLPHGALVDGAVTASAAWRMGPAMPHARHSMGACVYLGRVSVLGGCSPTLDLYGSDAILFLDVEVSMEKANRSEKGWKEVVV